MCYFILFEELFYFRINTIAARNYIPAASIAFNTRRFWSHCLVLAAKSGKNDK
jgi:hypothetical protein